MPEITSAPMMIVRSFIKVLLPQSFWITNASNGHTSGIRLCWNQYLEVSPWRELCFCDLDVFCKRRVSGRSANHGDRNDVSLFPVRGEHVELVLALAFVAGDEGHPGSVGRKLGEGREAAIAG